jgi:hypothetical protein
MSSPTRKRGPYRKSYLVPHGRGFKFLRSVPERFRDAVGKTAWVQTLGDVSREEALRQAAGLNLAVEQELASLKRLSPAQLVEIGGAGGTDGWRARVAEIKRLDRISVPFPQKPPTGALPDSSPR